MSGQDGFFIYQQGLAIHSHAGTIDKEPGLEDFFLQKVAVLKGEDFNGYLGF